MESSKPNLDNNRLGRFWYRTMIYQLGNIADIVPSVDRSSSPADRRIFATVGAAQGAFRDLDDRRYYYAIVCLIDSTNNGAIADDDDVALILRELDTSDPEEYVVTLAELTAAQALGDMIWRIPALDWDLVFYRHIPITHSP